MFGSQGQCAQLLSFRKTAISLFAEYILSYIFLKRTNTLLFTWSSIFYITTKKHFILPYLPLIISCRLSFLLLLYSDMQRSVVTFLVWFSQHRNQTKILSFETEVLYFWFTAAQSVWARGQEELLFPPLRLWQWTTEKSSFSQTHFTSHIDKQVK